MKVEDYIKQRDMMPKRKARPLGDVEAMMITHERAGMLTRTVNSFLEHTPQHINLTIFDDGSVSHEKQDELVALAHRRGQIRVRKCLKSGFIGTWLTAFEWARANLHGVGGIICLEDDLSFATGWSDILIRMYEGAADLGYMPGAMCCLRVHEVAQNRIENLRGVEAYQSMGHSFQVNLMPWEVIENKALIEMAAGEARAGRHGIDIYLLGRITDRMRRTNFMSTESWVAHDGIGKSVVQGQGYRSLQHRGYGLVKELCDD